MTGSPAADAPHSYARRAGRAVLWRAAQLLVVNGLVLGRLLVLARLLSPDDFGLLAIGLTAISLALSVTELGIIPALVQQGGVSERQYRAAWTVGVLRGCAVGGGIVVLAPWIAELFAEPRAAGIVRVLALRPVLESLASIKVARLTRELEFRSLGVIRVSEALINTVFSIALAQALGVWALVAGTLVGAVASLIASYALAPHRPALALDREAVRPLLQFGRWVFAAALLVMATTVIQRVGVSRQLGAAALGLYFLAARLAFLPAEVAGDVVGAVAFPIYARFRANVPEATRAFRTVLAGLAAVLVPVCAILVVLAPALVGELLGQRWEGSAAIIRLLALASVVGLLGDVAVPLFQGFGRPVLVAVTEAAQLAAVGVLLWPLLGRYGLPGAAISWLAAVVVSVILHAAFLRRLLDHPLRDLTGRMAAVAGTAGVAALAALGVGRLVPGPVGVVAAAVGGGVMAALVLWGLDRRFELGLVRDLAVAFPQIGGVLGIAAARG